MGFTQQVLSMLLVVQFNLKKDQQNSNIIVKRTHGKEIKMKDLFIDVMEMLRLEYQNMGMYLSDEELEELAKATLKSNIHVATPEDEENEIPF